MIGDRNMIDSAPAYCRFKNIGIFAAVVAELKFRDVQRKIFAAYLVIAAHDAALNQRPKTLNRVGVDRADNVLTDLMVHGAMRIFAAKMIIDIVSVGTKQADFFLEIASRTNSSIVVPSIPNTTRATTLPFRLTAPTIGVLSGS